VDDTLAQHSLANLQWLSRQRALEATAAEVAALLRIKSEELATAAEEATALRVKFEAEAKEKELHQQQYEVLLP